MTTAERMYLSFARVVTPRRTPIDPFSEIADSQKQLWELRAIAFEGRNRRYPLDERLYRSVWDGMYDDTEHVSYVRAWRAVDHATRTTWRLIAEAFTALEREREDAA